MSIPRKNRLFALVVAASLLSLAAPAQRNYTGNYNNANELMTDVSGKPIYLQVNYNIEGSPFYHSEYFRASIYTGSGRIYPGINVKFNLMDDLLLMKLDDGMELVAITPVSRVIFTDNSREGDMMNVVFEKGFPAVNAQTGKTWYEALDTGKVKLLKHRKVTYDDKRYYGQASITRVFEQTESFYLYFSKDATMKKLEKGKDALLSLFNDRKEELNGFIKQANLKCRKEEDWIKIIAYYNSLAGT